MRDGIRVTILFLCVLPVCAQTPAERLASPDRDTVLEALGALKRGAASQQAVVALLEHPDALIRQVACRTLGRIGQGDRRIAAILAKEIDRKDMPHAAEAIRALHDFGANAEPAVPALGRALSRDEEILRAAAAEALGRIGPPAAPFVPKLIELWRDPQRTVRAQALRATEAMGPAAKPALEAALQSSDPGTRYTAAWHLHKLSAAPTGIVTDEYPTLLRQVSQSEFPAPGGKRLLATIHEGDERPGELRLHAPAPGGWRLSRKLEGLPPGEGQFQTPQHFRQNGHHFLYIALRIDGTGAMHEDTILWIAPDLTLHDVPFTPAPAAAKTRLAPGEGIWKGEINTFSNTTMTFHFFIWKEGDGNCCPSAGEGEGNYVLSGAPRFDTASKTWKHSFRITPGAWRRLPAQP
ncbi:MAG: HEAT repeat domain-containing protein [Acidobacteria bacterium]|nr:HEAT repeat domain-containing protein [Acidobacteriota bacterium]